MRNYNQGEVICKYGEPGEEYYILEEGQAEVRVMDDDGVLEQVKTISDGTGFGELALLYNAPRAATIKAKTNCLLWVLDRNTFNHIVKDASM